MLLRLLALAAVLLTSTQSQAETVRLKWTSGDPIASNQPWSTFGGAPINGWTNKFMNGTVEEKGKLADAGELEAEIRMPKGANGPVPFVILLHGCSGLNTALKRWADDYSIMFLSKGIGVLILDSFKTRGVTVANNDASGICEDPSQLNWARRRADDAYSALQYLVDRKLAIPDNVYVLGRSNGATTVLLIMHNNVGKAHAHKFARGFALQPSCLYHNGNTFYAPVHLYLAALDTWTSPTLCMKVVAAFTNNMAKAIVYKGAHHGFQDKVPVSTNSRGQKSGYDPAAANGTIKNIVENISADIGMRR